MSDNRRVTFSNLSPPLKGVLKHTESHHRDSGVGSSSSEHTGSSGSLDERFTALDYDIQSNDAGALREALISAHKEVERWKNKYNKRNDECTELRRKERELRLDYSELFEHDTKVTKENAELKDELDKVEAERDDWSTRYYDLHDAYTALSQSDDLAIMSGGSGQPSQRLQRTSSQRAKKGSSDMTERVRERINPNRDQKTGSSHASRSSHNSESATSSKRSNKKPYIERLPADNDMVSPRQPGTFTLGTVDRRSTADTTSSSAPRRHGTASSSHSSRREGGDYVPHALPSHGRRPT